MVKKLKLHQWLNDILVGFWMAVAVLTIWGWVHHQSDTFAYFSSLWSLLCLFIGSGLMWGRKFLQKSASKVLLEDKRPPVIYLRSFKDDKVTSHPISESGMPLFYTEEEYLVDVLNEFGPCVAIGQPGEKLPELGAARMYLDNNIWQDKVREFLAASQLIVLRAGNTQNFLWEVEQSARSLRPEHIVILIPRQKNIYDQFRLRANQYLPKPLPENSKEPAIIWGMRGMGSLSGYIYFDQDWTSHFIKFLYKTSFWEREYLSLPKYIIQHSLAPVYERFGMSIPKRESGSLSALVVSFILAVLLLSMLGRYLNQL